MDFIISLLTLPTTLIGEIFSGFAVVIEWVFSGLINLVIGIFLFAVLALFGFAAKASDRIFIFKRVKWWWLY